MLVRNPEGLIRQTTDKSVDGTDLQPNTGSLASNATFAAEAQTEYDQNKTGRDEISTYFQEVPG
jgi:hypothetical protein